MKYHRIIISLIAVFLFTASGFLKTDIIIKLLNIRSNKGNILISMYNKPDQFPDNPKWKYLIPKSKLMEQGNRFQIKDVLAGQYAIAIIDDENCDTLLQKNFLGIPKEGYGFSNNSKPSIKGAPSFEDCIFLVDEGGKKILEIELQYLFKEKDH